MAKVTVTATATHFHTFKAVVEIEVPDFIANNPNAMELASKAYVKAKKNELPWQEDSNTPVRKKVDGVHYEINGVVSETLTPEG